MAHDETLERRRFPSTGKSSEQIRIRPLLRTGPAKRGQQGTHRSGRQTSSGPTGVTAPRKSPVPVKHFDCFRKFWWSPSPGDCFPRNLVKLRIFREVDDHGSEKSSQLSPLPVSRF